MRKISYGVFRELGGDLPGDRLCSLLQAIARVGSINGAAGELKMSYRYAWGLLKAAEERLACSLLAKRVGGVAGGGAELTDEARRLVEQYRLFRASVESRAGTLLQDDAAPAEPEVRHPVLLATTIGPVETGLLPMLETAFLEETGIPVRHIAAGSGQALQIAREGRVDMVLSHAPTLEAAFLAGGWGVARYPLMSGEFVLLGPASDPAGAATAGSAAEAFRRCAAGQIPFASRGDHSGTHLRELALWEAAGIQPQGRWYQVCSRGALGSLATLRFAEQLQGYVLVDRAAYLAARAEGLLLAPLVQGDPELRNPFSLLLVNPDRFTHVQGDAARRFALWATQGRAQALIAEFGLDRFGEPIFHVCS